MTAKTLTAEDFKVEDDPFCEHCGYLEPGVPTYFDGKIYRCLFCLGTRTTISEEESNKVIQMSVDWAPLPMKLFLFTDTDYDPNCGKNLCSGRYVIFAHLEEEAFEELEDHLEGNKHKDKILAQIKAPDTDQPHRWIREVFEMRQGVQ